MVGDLQHPVTDEAYMFLTIETLLRDCFGDLAEKDGFAPHFKKVPDDPYKNLDSMVYILGQFSLIHSEVSEAVEAFRRGNGMDDKLPDRKAVEVELADVVIRCIKLCHHLDLDLAGAIVEKEMYNRTRDDHKKENREAKGGKRF